MKRRVLGLMIFCSSLILEASTSQQLSGSLSSLREGLLEEEDEDGVSISKKDAPQDDVRREELLLSSSPRQIFTQGLRIVVSLFAIPPPPAHYAPEELEETRAMRDIVLANDETAATQLLKKIGPACAERLIAGIAPVHMVSFPKDRVPMLQLLMGGGVSIETKTEEGETPLQIALIRGNQPVAQALIFGGAEFGEKETRILESLSAEEPVVQALTALLGKAKQDRLVSHVIGAREKLEADKKKQEEARQALEQAAQEKEELDKRQRLAVEERSRQELEGQTRRPERKKNKAQEEELQAAVHASRDEDEDGQAGQEEEIFLHDDLGDTEGSDGQQEEEANEEA